MKLADLAPTDDSVTLEALHVVGVASAPDRFYGQIGNNTFTVRRGEGFDDVVAANDVLQITQSETGVYEATSKLGTRPNAATEYQTYELPWDYQQIGWDGGSGSTFYSGINVLPVALVRGYQDSPELTYGRIGGIDRTAVAYWGHSARWAYPTAGVEPAQKLSVLVSEPNPVPLELTLLAAHYPSEAHTPVDVPITPSIDYFGPDVANVIDLPDEWIDALADGSAGSIMFAPSGTDPGLTHVAAGPVRSLSLHT